MGRKPSTKLYNLVHTLTPAEQGYVKKSLQAPLGRKAGSMLQLFDALVKAKAPDSSFIEEVLKQMGGSASQLKTNLYNQILRLLRTLHADLNSKTLVTTQIVESEILMQKSLLPEAYERLQDAYETAYSNYQHDQVAQVLSLMIHLLRIKPSLSESTDRLQLLQDREYNLQQAYISGVLLRLSGTLIGALRAPERFTLATEFLQHEYVRIPFPTTYSERCKFYHHHVRSVIFYIQNNGTEQLVELKTLRDIFEKYPVFKQEELSITVLANLLTSYIQLQDIEEAKIVLQQLQSITQLNGIQADVLYYNVARGNLYVLLLEGKFQEIIECREAIVNTITLYPIHQPIVYSVWQILSAVAYYYMGFSSNCLQLLQQIFAHEALHAHQLISARLLELMCLLRDKEYGVSTYRIRSFQRQYTSEIKARALLQAFVSTLHYLATESAKAASTLQNLQTILAGSIENPTDRTMRVTLQLDKWVEARLSENVYSRKKKMKL